MAGYDGRAGRGIYSAGSPAGYGQAINYLPRWSPNQVGGIPPQLTGAKVRAPRPRRTREPSQSEKLEQMVAAFGCEPTAGVKSALEYLCQCVVRELHNTVIGARPLGHIAPPPRAIGMSRSVGYADVAPIPLPPVGPAGAYMRVLVLRPNFGRAGSIRFFNTALDDPFFFPLVEWRLLLNGGLYDSWFGPFDGGPGNLVGPLDWAIFRGGALVLEARNTGLVGTPNAMARAIGWQFTVQHQESGDWQQFLVDGG